jgi:hypothetical protein
MALGDLAPRDTGIRLSPAGVPIEYDPVEIERERLEAEARERSTWRSCALDSVKLRRAAGRRRPRTRRSGVRGPLLDYHGRPELWDRCSEIAGEAGAFGHNPEASAELVGGEDEHLSTGGGGLDAGLGR